jgi:flavorubredoxin
MGSRIDHIIGDVYRISRWSPASSITFNQFLIADERPTLIHTGRYPDYENVRAAIAEVLDPSRLEYVILLHFEADECGGMDRFLEAAPESVLAGSWLSVGVNLRRWSYRGRLQGFKHGDTLNLGRHRLRFLETPHVHHWDSMMVFDETTRSLFPADLFMQAGDQPPIVKENLGSEMCALYRYLGIFAHEEPVRSVLDTVDRLQPQWVHAMHGGSLTADALPYYMRALREQPFAFQGKLIGRTLSSDQIDWPEQIGSPHETDSGFPHNELQ